MHKLIVLSIVERCLIQCPFIGGSSLRGSTVMVYICSKSIDSEILFGEVHLSIFGELAHFFFFGPQVSALSSSMTNAKFIQKLGGHISCA